MELDSLARASSTQKHYFVCISFMLIVLFDINSSYINSKMSIPRVLSPVWTQFNSKFWSVKFLSNSGLENWNVDIFQNLLGIFKNFLDNHRDDHGKQSKILRKIEMGMTE